MPRTILDVSKWQGSIDWDKVKASGKIDGVMLRVLGSKGGKPRTMVVVMFCPGGGGETASASAVRVIDFNSNHAKSPIAGLQRVLKAPADFKVERMSGDLKPGGRVAGKIAGKVASTTFTLEFDLALPTKEAAAGFACAG